MGCVLNLCSVIAGLTRNPLALAKLRGSRVKPGMTPFKDATVILKRREGVILPIRSLLSVSLILRYNRGSLTYSHLRTSATNAALYELADAMNSLQSEPFESVNKSLSHRIAAM